MPTSLDCTLIQQHPDNPRSPECVSATLLDALYECWHHCTDLYYSVLLCNALYCFAMHCTALYCRLPLEAESAALGAALQAAAVHIKVPVGQYVRDNQPPVSDQVGMELARS